MPTATHAPMVTIAELARVLAVPPEQAVTLAHQADAKVTSGWDRMLRLSEADAGKILEAHKAEEQANYLRQVEFQAKRRQWEHDRQQAWQTAYAKAHTEAMTNRIEAAQHLNEHGLEGDSTGKGWASAAPGGVGGFPVGFASDSRTDQLARTAARHARDAWLEKHPEPQP